jgi:fimbrial chaperone protein
VGTRRLLPAIVAAAAFGLPVAAAHGGTFTISPLRVELSQSASTAALTVRNEESKPVVVQAEALLWQQAGGIDQLTATHDVLVSPPVFTIPANGSQLIRLALRRPVDPSRELTYRLLLQEVPSQPDPQFTGLTVALRLSIPVFVAATQPAEPTLEWSASRASNGALAITARNDGTAHARVFKFSVQPVEAGSAAIEQSVAAYILAGQARTWTLDNDTAKPAATNRLRLKGITDRGEIEAELAVARE